MRILYGVQATGQGHISRARAMARALEIYPVEVDWLLSGRKRSDLFDVEPFGDFKHRRGLTFTTQAGRIQYLRTALDNSLFQFIRDVRELDVSGYDAIVTDFEPVTAWAGKLRGKTTIGIGHQYAFDGQTTPARGDDWLSRIIMRQFAPVSLGLGLHWHHYNPRTLPPILDLEEKPEQGDDHILVYLPFEDQDRVTHLLNRFENHRFIQYSASVQDMEMGNVLRQRANIPGFKQHLVRCRGVICNSGFELISECLQLGKPILTKPVNGQMEQLSNALALEQLGYATTMDDLDILQLDRWLQEMPDAIRLDFPDVAATLAAWLAGGCEWTPSYLSEKLWAGAQRALRLSPAPPDQPHESVTSRSPPNPRRCSTETPRYSARR